MNLPRFYFEDQTCGSQWGITYSNYWNGEEGWWGIHVDLGWKGLGFFVER